MQVCIMHVCVSNYHVYKQCALRYKLKETMCHVQELVCRIQHIKEPLANIYKSIHGSKVGGMMGRTIVRAFVMAIKGDWPWLRTALKMPTSWSSDCMCWKCWAQLQGNPVGMHFGNGAFLLPDSWSFTMHGFPWDPDDPPALSELEGFEGGMAEPDTLHSFFLGTGRDLVGAAIVFLVAARALVLQPL